MTGMWDRDPPSALWYHPLLVHTKILKKIYTTSLMTPVFVHVIVCTEENQSRNRWFGKVSRTHRGSKLLAHRARDGKAMLQILMYSLINTNRPYDLLDTIMPSADKAERAYFDMPYKGRTKQGSRTHRARDGYLVPGIAMRILE